MDISTILNMHESYFTKITPVVELIIIIMKENVLNDTDTTYLYLAKHIFLSSIKMVKMKKPGYYTFQFQSQI